MEFVAYASVFSDLPTYADILNDPMYTQYRTEPSVHFALSNMIPAFIKIEDMEEIMKFISRLPIEFQIITCRGMAQRDPKLKKNKFMLRWMVANGRTYF